MNSALPDFGSDGDSDPLGVRFLDYDDDKRIDLLRTVAADSAQVWVNTGTAFVSRDVQPLGAMFDADPSLQLADMNGDGLQDAVAFTSDASQLRVRTSLGFGRWTDWQSISVSGFSASVLEQLELQDINGDGLSDVVLVGDTTVTYVVNRGGARFAPPATLTSADVEGDLPLRDLTRSLVLFADMNGSGSSDIVWITDGRVQFLELFPVRPNLLSRVETGLGGVQEIEYGTSVLQQARDAATAPWAHKLPNAMNIVVATDTWNRLFADETTGLHDTSAVVYRDGYYDGVNRAFRGFGHVERIDESDLEAEGQTGSRTVFDYDLGVTDAERYGLLLRSATFGGSAGAWSPLVELRMTWSDCPVAEATAMGPIPVRRICQTRVERIVQEGVPEAEWRTTRSETVSDGYGAMTRSVEHGVVHLGPPETPRSCGVCAPGSGPCGAECLGDERFVDSTFITPGAATGNAWILGRPVRRTTYGEAGGLAAVDEVRYDGPDFVGLPEGQLTRGLPTSARTRVDATTWLDTMRIRRDANGNVVEEITARGSLAVTDEYRRLAVPDELGIRIARVEDLFHDREGAPVSLRRDYLYDPSTYQVSESTDWTLVRDGTPVSARISERYRYDAFGRPLALLRQGDTEATPSTEYVYEFASPVSRIVVRNRSRVGGPADLEEVQCLDGLGRTVQTRTRLADGRYQVSGFEVLNRRGSPVRSYEPFLASSGACDMSAPTDVPYDEFEYDGLARMVRTTDASESTHGSRSESRIVHRPFQTLRYDAEDNDPSSPHHDTPSVETYDGLERRVTVGRDLGDGTVERLTLTYDSLGRLASVRAPDGIEHTQTYDLLGRVLTSSDPDRGEHRYAYDAAGHIVETSDARGQRVAFAYDGLGRRVSEWDPSAEAATRIEFRFDEDPACEGCDHSAGRLVSTEFPLGDLGVGRDEVSYDVRGNVEREARTIGGHRFEIRHQYDGLGRKTRSEYPGGISLDYTFDVGSRPTGIGGIVDDIGFDAQGRMTTLFYANGIRSVRSYDDSGRLEALETMDSARVLQGVSIRRDRVGNVTSLLDTSEPEAARPSMSGQFTYDAWYRLTQATLGDATLPEETLALAYDRGDRLTSAVSSLGDASRAHVGELAYDAVHPNAVRQAGALEYVLDAAGHTTRRGETSLAYDHQGRLESVSDASGTTGRFYYGAGAARIAKVEHGSVTYYLGNEAEVRDGIVSVYPRLGMLRLARLRTDAVQAEVLTDVAPLVAGDGEINAADAWVSVATAAGLVDGAPDADEAMRLLSGAARRLLTLDGGDRAYLHQDRLGSTTLATGQDGQVLGEVQYYLSGAVRHHSGFVDEYGFSSQEMDESSGLWAYGFRQLDPAIGRWTSADPSFDTLGGSSVSRAGEAMSGYAYVANQYGNAIDPLGLAGQPAQSKAAPGKWERFTSWAGGGLSRAGASIQRFAAPVTSRWSAFSKAHPTAARMLGRAARLGLSVLIGFAIAGPAGALGALVLGVCTAALGEGIRGVFMHTSVGRGLAKGALRGWGSMSWGAKLGVKLAIGAVGIAIAAGLLLSGNVTALAEIGNVATYTTNNVITSGVSLVGDTLSGLDESYRAQMPAIPRRVIAIQQNARSRQPSLQAIPDSMSLPGLGGTPTDNSSFSTAGPEPLPASAVL